ncbi:multiple organellar RNA editing factor 5, chloroplastic/mitochondrial [Medicago truncatula]|uniref:multiple organellar RNA editing factor 5, chloroplastic/mitochondrial n=1 Tax=Medicago truncatula TaxID=3880 RepID=UPI0019676D7F|nr:multiple organellar RNA editing factor 5, chloroplastic/mitochondrial [Medicago truncatula]
MARIVSSSFTRLSTQFTTRLFSTTAALSKPSSLTLLRFVPMSQTIRQSLNTAARFGGIHSRAYYSSSLSDGGLDYKHWVIAMDNPGGKDSSWQEKIDCYIQTLGHVLGSVVEAKKKIYSVYCFKKEFGFGCEIDEQTKNNLGVMPGVMFILPDVYMDIQKKYYGGELLVNGEVV